MTVGEPPEKVVQGVPEKQVEEYEEPIDDKPHSSARSWLIGLGILIAFYLPVALIIQNDSTVTWRSLPYIIINWSYKTLNVVVAHIFPIIIGIALVLFVSLVRRLSILSNEQVVERWNAMISGAAGKGGDVTKDIKRLLHESKAPDIRIEQRRTSAGIIQCLVNGKRPFTIVSNRVNSNIKPYKIYINTQEYGINLVVSWYLVYQPSLFEKLLNLLLCIPILGMLLVPAYSTRKLAASKEGGILRFNLFDEQNLRAYVTNAHHCVLDAVDKLIKGEPKIEAPQFDRRSQGFLGIS